MQADAPIDSALGATRGIKNATRTRQHPTLHTILHAAFNIDTLVERLASRVRFNINDASAAPSASPATSAYAQLHCATDAFELPRSWTDEWHASDPSRCLVSAVESRWEAFTLPDQYAAMQQERRSHDDVPSYILIHRSKCCRGASSGAECTRVHATQASVHSPHPRHRSSLIFSYATDERSIDIRRKRTATQRYSADGPAETVCSCHTLPGAATMPLDSPHTASSSHISDKRHKTRLLALQQIDPNERHQSPGRPVEWCSVASLQPIATNQPSVTPIDRSEVESLMLQYLLACAEPWFDLSRLQPGSIVNQFFLLTAMPMPTDAPDALRVAYDGMRQSLLAIVSGEEYSHDRETNLLLTFGQPQLVCVAEMPLSEAPYAYLEVMANLQQAFQRWLSDPTVSWQSFSDDRINSSEKVPHEVERLTHTLVMDWLEARSHQREAHFIASLASFIAFFESLMVDESTPPKCAQFWTHFWRSPITIAVMYLATHVIFVQNDYMSKEPLSGDLIALQPICVFLAKNISVAERYPLSELVSECIALFHESPAHRYLCTSLWRKHVAVGRRYPPLPTAKKQLPKNVHHFIITLQHVYLSLLRGASSVVAADPLPRASVVQCGDDCLNRRTFVECTTMNCRLLPHACTNRTLSRAVSFPGIETFKTKFTGWGLRSAKQEGESTLKLVPHLRCKFVTCQSDH
jgi:hypothetical protein